MAGYLSAGFEDRLRGGRERLHRVPGDEPGYVFGDVVFGEEAEEAGDADFYFGRGVSVVQFM